MRYTIGIVGFLFFSTHSFSQGLLIVKENIKLDKIEIFYPLERFCNPIYLETIDIHDGDIEIQLPHHYNGIFELIVNGKGVEVYIGERDTIEITIDPQNKEIVITGDNAMYHNKYRALRKLNKEYYPWLFSYPITIDSDSSVYDDLLMKAIEEISLLDKELNSNGQGANACLFYKTSQIIRMLYWIKRNSPPEYDWTLIADKIVQLSHINLDIVRFVPNNIAFYEVYYSLKNGNHMTNPSGFLNDYKYILNANEEVRNYITQSLYIAHFRFVADRSSLCNLYNEIKQYLGNILYKHFFSSMNPCE